MRTLPFLTVLLTPTLALAQVNDKGTLQLGFAFSGGVHATEFKNSFRLGSLEQGTSSSDGAATVSFPLEFQGGLSKRFSLGAILEPGRYIDSAGTHPNGFFVFSISPRYYLVNKEKAALFLSADIGAGFLRIGEVSSGAKQFDDTYAGGHFRLGTQFQYYFGNTFGLNFGLKYALHNLKWRDRDPEDAWLQNLDYEATLRTSGVQVQLGAQVKF